MILVIMRLMSVIGVDHMEDRQCPLVEADRRFRPETSGRVQHKRQVDGLRLNRAVPEPAKEIVDRDATRQQVTGVAVAQRVI